MLTLAETPRKAVLPPRSRSARPREERRRMERESILDEVCEGLRRGADGGHDQTKSIEKGGDRTYNGIDEIKGIRYFRVPLDVDYCCYLLSRLEKSLSYTEASLDRMRGWVGNECR